MSSAPTEKNSNPSLLLDAANLSFFSFTGRLNGRCLGGVVAGGRVVDKHVAITTQVADVDAQIDLPLGRVAADVLND